MTVTNRRPFALDDILRQEMVQSITVSSDGTQVVYALRTTELSGYRTSLWTIDLETAASSRLTDGRSSDMAPELSPDDTQLLFLSDRGGSVQPWVAPAAGGEATQVAELPGDVRLARWSPSGEQLLVIALSGESRFCASDPQGPVARHITDITYRSGVGFRDEFASVWVVDARTSAARRLTRPDHEVFDATWGADDSTIFMLADLDRSLGQHEVPQAHRLVLSGDQPPAYEPLPPLGGEVVRVAVSPSGRVAVLAYEHANSSWSNVGLFVLDADRFQRLGESLDRSFQKLSYSDIVDGGEPVLKWQGDDAVLVTLSSEGRNYPCRVTTTTAGVVEVLADGDIVATDLASGGGQVFTVANIGGSAGELYHVDGKNLVQLTSASDWMRPIQREAEEFRFRSTSAAEIQAWVLRASPDAASPTVLHLHGGPHACHGPTPWLEMLALVDAGITVIYPNFKGSGGYGDAYSGSVNGQWGLADGQEVVDLADWAVTSGLAEPGRIGVMGCSYGGFMTTWLLGHHPGVFAAGISENPVTDMIGLYGEGDQGTATSKLSVGPDARLPEDLPKFLERSPFVELHRNESPLLFLQADLDLRSPAGQTELAFAILRTRDVPCEMVRYPDEGHMMLLDGRPDRRIDRLGRITGWFTEHL